MPSTLQIDPNDFDEVIQRAVDAVVDRLRSTVPANEAGQVLLTKRQTAEVLAVSEFTVDRLRKRGLPYIKLDSKVLFRRRAIEAWARENEVREEATQ